jgi:D-glycero-D-manno-heptose 1,7-bisphosphate phosphatase
MEATRSQRKKAVFLDRDGVVVTPIFSAGRSFAPTSMRDFSIEPTAATCLNRLRGAGFLLVVVTNQPDVGAGIISEQTLDEMHSKLRRDLPVDAIHVCVHTVRDGCACRKPKPGMLLEAAAQRGIDLRRSIMVGDRASDTAAGAAAGCATAFLDLSYEAEAPPNNADFYGSTLRDITDWIISGEVDAR